MQQYQATGPVQCTQCPISQHGARAMLMTRCACHPVLKPKNSATLAHACDARQPFCAGTNAAEVAMAERCKLRLPQAVDVEERG